MYIPLFSFFSKKKRSLHRRKGGGGGGKGGRQQRLVAVAAAAGARQARQARRVARRALVRSLLGASPLALVVRPSYGAGGGKPFTIPSGQLFAGRQVGGGTRGQVFGSRYATPALNLLVHRSLAPSHSTYGSGYPGIAGRGVGGRGFPFGFWPIVWGAGCYWRRRVFVQPRSGLPPTPAIPPHPSLLVWPPRQLLSARWGAHSDTHKVAKRSQHNLFPDRGRHHLLSRPRGIGNELLSPGPPVKVF